MSSSFDKRNEFGVTANFGGQVTHKTINHVRGCPTLPAHVRAA